MTLTVYRPPRLTGVLITAIPLTASTICTVNPPGSITASLIGTRLEVSATAEIAVASEPRFRLDVAACPTFTSVMLLVVGPWNVSKPESNHGLWLDEPPPLDGGG